MKKVTKLGMYAMMMAAAVAATSCNEGDGDGNDLYDGEVSKSIYCQYTLGVATALQSTTEALYEDWIATGGDYRETFLNGTADANYQDKGSVEDMIDGVITIVAEVRDAKIEEPWADANVYGVESWYSFNSWMDYRDNIYSIQNVFYGSLLSTKTDAERATLTISGNADANSMASKFTSANTTAINDAINACIAKFNTLVDAGVPFRDYVLEKANSGSNLTIYTATISDLEDLLTDIEEAFDAATTDANIDSNEDDIMENFVDDVVIPTYKALNEQAELLLTAVTTYTTSMTQTNIDAACTQWKATRRPWEQSEAFLLGPVDEEGYDPHMDSWPLSQFNINLILNQSSLPAADTFTDVYSDNVLGFHALEYTLYRNGEPRDLSEFVDGDIVYIEATNEMVSE